MRILMVGDIVGRSGRIAAMSLIPAIRSEENVDVVIANGENAAAGNGITTDIAAGLLTRGGVDIITLGNHAWTKREAYALLDDEPKIIRPANYPPGAPGRGSGVFHTDAGPIGVIALQGRTFMNAVDDPFRAADEIVTRLKQRVEIIFMDFHAEATSEKKAMGWHMDGRCSAVVGTHTHVQTADERVLPAGTAYITDVGMTGPPDSIIGMSVQSALPRFLTSLPSRFELADGAACLNGVLIDVDNRTGLSTGISRISRQHTG